jgi:hypothetical protein
MGIEAVAGWPEPAEFFAKLARMPDVATLDEAERQVLALELFRASFAGLSQYPRETVSAFISDTAREFGWRPAAVAILEDLQRTARELLTALVDTGDLDIDYQLRVHVRVEGDMIRAVVNELPYMMRDPERWRAYAQSKLLETMMPDRPLVYRRCDYCKGLMHTAGDARRRFCGDTCVLAHRREVSATLNRERRAREQIHRLRRLAKAAKKIAKETGGHA